MNPEEDLIAPEVPVTFLLGAAFESGEIVPVEEPAIYDTPEPEPAAEQFTLAEILDWMMIGAPDSRQSGDRINFVGYLMNLGRITVPRAPRSLRELAARLGCSHVAARDRLNRFKADFAGELRDLINSRSLSRDT